MRPIPLDCPLAVGDVLHHAAFGFAAVVHVEPEGASVRWEIPGSLSPAWISRASLRDAFHLCPADGLLALTVRDPPDAKRLFASDGLSAVGRLLCDTGPAETEELAEWLAGRQLLPQASFASWWRDLAPTLGADARFRREGERWTLADGVVFIDPVHLAAKPLGAPGTCAAGRALDLACDLAGALAALHAQGQTLAAGSTSFSRVGDRIVAAGRSGGHRSSDVAAVARIVLEQVLGVLPSPAQVPTSDLLASVADLAPDLPFELLGALEAALCEDLSLRPPDGFALLHALEMARATRRIRETFPQQPDAGVAVGFDSHIGISRALHAQLNQDSLLIAGDPDCALLVVADGISVSTAGSGDLASKLLVQSLRKWWQESADTLRTASSARIHLSIRDALARANRQILAEASKLVAGRLGEHVPMGTTIVLCVTRGNRVHLASLGDSRAWLVTCATACLLTSDQNLQAQLIREQIAGAEPDWDDERFALTGYCGHLDANGRPALPPLFTRTFTLMPNEWIVMATDGFSDFAHEEDAGLGRILCDALRQTGSPTPALQAMATARRVVQASNDGGGGDNVTVLAFTLSTDARPIRPDAPQNPG